MHCLFIQWSPQHCSWVYLVILGSDPWLTICPHFWERGRRVGKEDVEGGKKGGLLASRPLHLGATGSGKHLTILWFCPFAPPASSLFCQHLLILQDPGRIPSPRMASQVPYLSQLLSQNWVQGTTMPRESIFHIALSSSSFFFFCRQKHTQQLMFLLFSLSVMHTHTQRHHNISRWALIMRTLSPW